MAVFLNVSCLKPERVVNIKTVFDWYKVKDTNILQQFKYVLPPLFSCLLSRFIRNKPDHGGTTKAKPF